MHNVTLKVLKKQELGKYVAIGSTFFPHADWQGAPKRLGEMFDRWNEGILVVEDPSGAIVGYYTLWPVTKDAFEGFVEGRFKDEDMCIARMPPRMDSFHHHWILTAIAVQPTEHEYRKVIILKMLSDLRSRMVKNVPCHVLAHAATEDGHRFLSRSGFRNPNQSEPTVYTLDQLN